MFFGCVVMRTRVRTCTNTYKDLVRAETARSSSSRTRHFWASSHIYKVYGVTDLRNLARMKWQLFFAGTGVGHGIIP